MTTTAHTPRPNTPSRENPDGSTTITMKRHCNGCGQPIGDVTEQEIAAAIDGRPLPDVREECPTCTPRRDDPLAAIPSGYYAVPDPDQPDTMTYWRSQSAGRVFTAWPAKAKYGPLAYRKDRPKDHAAAVDWMRAHNELRRAWHERVLAAIADDPATAAARFAELTTRCLSCGRKLTDAKSKLLGIGPDCRRGAHLDDAVLCAHVTPRIAAAHAAHLADAASSSGSPVGARENGGAR